MADISTLEARRVAYRLLLNKGLIRIGLARPEQAEFEVVCVDDPYDCSRAIERAVYRRPLPATNLKFLSAVMRDGRETVPGQSIAAALQTQALNATLGHAEVSTRPTKAQLQSRPIAIADVGGLNDALDQKVIMGTCTTCHDTPNVGNHSLSASLDLGLSDAAQRTPDLPLFTLRCLTTGAVVRTSDPGCALITGKCANIGKMKGPVLRGPGARAPYFHNGAAPSLEEVVTFYDSRFQLKLGAEEIADLVAFLRSL
jgi:processive rubber oxygenase RoxA-like protein